MKITLFIPTFNEIQGIKMIMPRIKKEWVNEILIIDGNSTDGTKEWLEQSGYRVATQKEPGLLSAWWQGFETATGDIIISFSPDGNSVPELIPALVDKIKEGYDIVIASRYKDDAKSDDDTWMTGLGNFMFTKIINLLFGGHYTDALGMYRAFRKELITSLKLDNDKNEIFEVLLSIRAAKQRLKIAEIPGDEPPRVDKEDSRAHPGIWGKFKGGLKMISIIIKEFFKS
ncbi:MAG: glycosyltransferase family 2 protein [Patescibacteria group bacterium]|nr:glycosyltransferase family 2 protein [Patescibacteria group bacterium]